MNIFHHFHQLLVSAIDTLVAEGELSLPDGLPRGITVEPPRDSSHGDLSTNAAMVLAKPCKMKPRDIADLLQEKIEQWEHVTAVEVAGPGFINLRLSPTFWQQQIATILQEGGSYGNSTIGEGTRVNVEYVSANPTGPMHIGHARGAVVGDVLATLLLKAGYNVTKEYYINDAGSQVEVLARSVHLRYREALGEDIGDMPAGMYPGDYLVPVGEALAAQYGDKYVRSDEQAWLSLFQRYTVDAMMVMIRDDLAALGVAHDIFTSEAAIVEAGKVEQAVTQLEKAGLIYTGVLEPPKGKPPPDDWEERPQTLFKSAQFGDDVDRPLKKSDGSYTYFTPDIAYHYDKFQRGHDVLIDIWGVDHGGYVKRVKAAVAAITDGKAECHMLLCQLVKLIKNGEPFKMSKRAGTFVTLRDMLDEVGRDVLRFMMLTRKNDAPLDFDIDKALEQSKDNPVFYVHYAHARCCSVLRHASKEMVEAYAQAQTPDSTLLSKLERPGELALIQKMTQWPRVVESAASSFEPHRIAFYAQEVAAEFHSLWNQGNDNETLRFLIEDNTTLTAARLALVMATKQLLASALDVMGVEPMQEMQ